MTISSWQFARCISSKASHILWLIACSYNKYLEESRELKVIPPCYAFQLLMTSWWWFFVLWTWAFQTIVCFGRHVTWPISVSCAQQSLSSRTWLAFHPWSIWDLLMLQWTPCHLHHAYSFASGPNNRSISKGLFSTHCQGQVPTLCNSLSTGLFDPDGRIAPGPLFLACPASISFFF